MIPASIQPDGFERLRGYICQIAVQRSLPIEKEPEGLHADRLPLESVRDSARSNDADENPLAMLVIDGYTTLIGSLEHASDASSRRHALDEYHWRASNVRGWLSPSRKDDMALFLACPAGADSATDWLVATAEIEGDDRVCRKLLWLRPSAEDATESSLERLIARSFLACPWEAETSAGTENLDPWQRLEQELASADGVAAADADVLRAWKELLVAAVDAQGQPIAPGREFAERLIARLDGNSAP